MTLTTTYDLIAAVELRDGDTVVSTSGARLQVATARLNETRQRVDVRFQHVRGEFHYPLDWTTWITSRPTPTPEPDRAVAPHYPHHSGGVCEEPHCTRAGYDGHEMWDTADDFAAEHHSNHTVCRLRVWGCCDHTDHTPTDRPGVAA